MEMLPARKDWQEIFQVMKTTGLQLRLLYAAKLSVKMEGEIRSLPDKRRLKEYISTKPALQGLLKKKKNSDRQRNTGMKEVKRQRIRTYQ